LLRNLGAVLLGAFVGSCWNMALVMLNSIVLFPMPPGSDMNNPEQMNAYIRTLPTAAFLLMLAAHLGQSFFGGWVAARVGRSRPLLLALLVGGLSLIGGVLNMLTIRGPDWLYVELPLYLVVAWAAGRLEERRRAGLRSAA
jgi:MFS family permease